MSGLPLAVVEILAQGEACWPAVRVCWWSPSRGVIPADLGEGFGLPGLVAGGPVQVVGLPGVDVETHGGGLVDSSQQHRVFSGEPCQGLLVISGVFSG